MSQQDYRRKIKGRDELRAILGPRPRVRPVILCHGTFDLVHPGHIRHLMAAREKAEVLVVSLTCDAHITKANYRPFLPQELRAMNLAALEVVDFVLIDEAPDPLENLRFLQPDFFAKGCEYNADGLHPKTAREVEVVESYGGQVAFTPDDVVFSSSRFIQEAPPDLRAEKLALLMSSEGVTFGGLRSALGGLAGVRAHVVGDTIVDTHLSCSVIGGTAGSSTCSLKLESQVDALGGAAVVAKHLRRAGAEVVFSTVLGDDALGQFVRDDLEAAGVTCRAFVDRSRPTTQKNVFLADGQRMLKVNKVDNRPITDKALSFLTTGLRSTRADTVAFSDFRHGIFHRGSIPDLTANMPAGAVSVADSQVASRWGNVLDFQGFDLLTPNELEARYALGDQDAPARILAQELYRRAGCGTLILKLGKMGTLTCRGLPGEPRPPFAMDSFADQVADPVGAGDALLAYAALGLTATRSPVLASLLGSLAAAVICEREVNEPVAPDDLRRKLSHLERRSPQPCAA
jgi:cytidyltransferase-like protein